MRNHHAKRIGTTALLALALGACTSRAATPGMLDDAALLAYAKQPWDKAALMHTTVELGRHHGQRVVAEYPCGDVCPQYTARVIHYELADGVSCDSVGGVEQEVLMPVAITVRPKTFCFPKVLVDARLHYTR
ncbi:hypothetical protein ACO2Q2_08000 [Dyella sp. KRB-257]|uniref:hypothetical protein n=1 Tax=Dyella sp. KRB-257 TaxID=3400915 RepID=UPI003C10CC13